MMRGGCSFTSSGTSFHSEDLEVIRQKIASRPSVPLTTEEEQFLPRADDPRAVIPVPDPQAGQIVPSSQAGSSAEIHQAGPSVPAQEPNRWVEQVWKQIACKAKTPTYWGKTKARVPIM